MSNPSATVLNEINGHKTILFPKNKGPKTITWEQTKQMAFELNRQGYDIAFLPELTSETSADCLIKIGSAYRIADFKYCITTNSNTLAKDLKHGFSQANTIVLKIKKMDSGLFKDAVDYLLRNNIPYGDIILINNYSRILELHKKEFRTGIYKKTIKGFL